MRDLTFDAIPDADALRAGIPDPARFRPEPKVVALPRWRPTQDGWGELWVEPPGTWRLLHPVLVTVNRGLEAGWSVERMIEAAGEAAPTLSRRQVSKLARDYVLELANAGFLRLDFEPIPPVFAERYERLRELGRGGMGIVHLARDRVTGADVVVKHAWGWSSEIGRAERALRWEAAALSRLDHASVPRLLALFEDRGLLHIVREFAPGTPLGRGPPLAAPERRARLAAAALPIAHVHERGLVHLDVKPDNFIVGTDGVVRLLDLGIARPCGPGGVELRKAIGSPGFAAPEVRRSHRAEAASDQYSLGCVLFFLAARRRPSRTWDASALVTEARRTGMPEAEVSVLERMTAPSPRDRYPDVPAAVRALLEVAE